MRSIQLELQDQVSARAERLSKMSTTPPSFRAPAVSTKTRVSPVLGPRAGGIVPQANLSRHENDANNGSLANVRWNYYGRSRFSVNSLMMLSIVENDPEA